MQKMIYELEEQLHNEMQLKDEMEQKCRWDLELRVHNLDTCNTSVLYYCFRDYQNNTKNGTVILQGSSKHKLKSF